MNSLYSIINFHFEKAKAIGAWLRKKNLEPPLGKILWLSSTPLTFLFKPSLTDIFYLEQIGYTSSTETFLSINKKRSKQWIHLPQDGFIDTLRQLDCQKEKGAEILRLYSSWLAESRNRPSAYYSIEFLARRYVYNELDNESDIPLQKAWETYLAILSKSTHAEVKARGVFESCLLYK